MPRAEIVLLIHVLNRLQIRGTNQEEIKKVLEGGKEQEAKKGRKAKEMVFQFNDIWKGKFYEQKKVKAIYVSESDKIIVITVYTYYGKWR